jgi:hypothetical protein
MGEGRSGKKAMATMEFKVIAASYDAAAHLLSYTASGLRNGLHFTVSSRVKCLKDPGSSERLHMVVLLALTDHFKRPSPSGLRW